VQFADALLLVVKGHHQGKAWRGFGVLAHRISLTRDS
jgi:hypothetical protein